MSSKSNIWPLSHQRMPKGLVLGRDTVFRLSARQNAVLEEAAQNGSHVEWNEANVLQVVAADWWGAWTREQSRSVKAAARARRVFSWVELLCPKRVAMEEIGDALELIDRLATDPRCSRRSLKITVKMITTIFWVGLNSIRQISSSLLGKKAE